MAGLRDVLNRFRPSGSPGAATPAGVPSDRRAGVAAELEPVFAAMAATLDRCRRTEAAATAWAKRTAVTAQQRVEATMATARADAPAARGNAAARIAASAQREAAGIDEAATQRLIEAATVAESTRAGLVEEIVARVRKDIAALDPIGPR